MNARLSIALFLVLTLAVAACSINDPFLIALNLPLESCGNVNTGTSWDNSATVNLQDEINGISTSYLDDVRATRVTDLRIYMPTPPSGSGTGSGVVRCGVGGGPLVTIMTFTNVPFASFAGKGISIATARTNPGQVNINEPGLASFIAQVTNPSGLPVLTSVTIASSGSTSTAVPQGTTICAVVDYQADVEVNM